MSRLVMIIFFLLSFSLACCIYGTDNTSEKEKLSYKDLAAYWAPIIMQDTDDTNYRGDYITCYTYDGDYIARNNWENLNNYPLNAYVYYWVAETETHYFIGYALFHPRDWSDWLPYFDEHENDLEGVILCIKKEDIYGKFLVMVTIAHLDFYSYKDFDLYPSANITDGHEDIDGDVEFVVVSPGDSLNQSGVFCGIHPYIYVEAKGHGIYGAERWESSGFPGNDGIIYYPSSIAEEPESGNDRFCRYSLIHIDELWERRYDSQIFKSYGTFDKDNGFGEAHAPWAWDDKDDGECGPPDFFDDPAYLLDYYHDGFGIFSHIYLKKSWNYLAETFHNCISGYERTIWWKTNYKNFRVHFQRISVASSDKVQILDANGNVLWEFTGDQNDIFSPIINSSVFGIKIKTYTDRSWGYSADYIIEEVGVKELELFVAEPPIVTFDFFLLFGFLSLLHFFNGRCRRNYDLVFN